MDINKQVSQESFNSFQDQYMNNLQPVDEISGFQVRPGFYGEFGTTVIPGGVSFTVHSKHATEIKLALFKRREEEPFGVIPFPETYRIGDVYSMIVFGLKIEEFEYAYYVDGPYDPLEGHIFDPNDVLLDPYAKAVTGQSQWGEKPPYGQTYRARVVGSNFDWKNSKKPVIPIEDLVIYELHVRGFTKDVSSHVKNHGTYKGLKEKIPYLKELGVNAIELMPIFEFDEMRGMRIHNGNKLYDYWGYNPISFFAPNTGYNANSEYNHEGKELKELVKACHDNGIEVILDVVFNHTAEGNEQGPSINLKGFDNSIYYMLTPDGHYYNFSGTGNTLNCNHPVVRRMIVDCLRHWVIEYRVDGFRFDLASILGRNEDGSPMDNPPLLQNLAYDSVLADVKLIAEAWDAGGLYQVGTFPDWNRWTEWNGMYRDDMRRFLKGDEGLAHTACDRIAGSIDIYPPEKRNAASVNFITCHDGFTMYDLYSYNQKYNEANGWHGTDGTDDNFSWNCGHEGPTEDEGINALRHRMVRNAFTTLLMSRGTPMLTQGDEFLRTQQGNNNPYCQDNEISWLNWDLLEKNKDMFNFVKQLIALRKEYPILRKQTSPAKSGYPSYSKHGTEAWYLSNSKEIRVIGVMFSGRNESDTADDYAYISVNSHWEEHKVELPRLPDHYEWQIRVNTSVESKNAFLPAGKIKALDSPDLIVPARSTIVLIGTHSDS